MLGLLLLLGFLTAVLLALVRNVFLPGYSFLFCLLVAFVGAFLTLVATVVLIGAFTGSL